MQKLIICESAFFSTDGKQPGEQLCEKSLPTSRLQAAAPPLPFLRLSGQLRRRNIVSLCVCLRAGGDIPSPKMPHNNNNCRFQITHALLTIRGLLLLLLQLDYDCSRTNLGSQKQPTIIFFDLKRGFD